MLELFLLGFETLCEESVMSELPPLQGIQHHIDFVHGASLPNLLHYHITLVNHAELHMQILDLLFKVFFQ